MGEDLRDALWDGTLPRTIHLDCSNPGRVVLRVKSEQLADAHLVGAFPDEASARAAARRILDSEDHAAEVKAERRAANDAGVKPAGRGR